MRIFGSISRLVSLLFRKDGQDITVRPNQSTTYTSGRDMQLPPGDADQVLVSATSTQTLTNKTLGAGSSVDADVVAVTNIENADIKAGAAIDAAKLADGSVSNTEFQYLNGVTSGIQGQLDAKLDLAGGTMSGNIDMGSNSITNLAAPSAGTDAVNKNYVDNAINGLSWKMPVLGATTGNINVTSIDLVDGAVHDNVTFSTGDRILVKNQTDPKENGIYVIAAAAPASRAADMDSTSPINEVNSAAVFVVGGTLNGGKGFVQTSPVDNVGLDNITFAQFSAAGAYTGGTGITITGNSIATNDAQIVHDNLSGFVANEHIDHSSVSIATGASSGLSGGGDLTTTRNLVVDPNAATSVTAAAGDLILIADASDSNALKKVTAQSIADLAAGSSAQSFVWTDGSATKACTHTFSTKAVLVEVYDENDVTVYVDSVDRSSTSQVDLTRSEATVGGNWTVVIRN